MLRVIWRSNPTAILPPGVTPQVPHIDPQDAIFAGLPLVRVEPVFSNPAHLQTAFQRMSPAFRSDARNDLNSYAHAFVGDLASAKLLVQRLKADPAQVDPRSVEMQGPPRTIGLLVLKNESRTEASAGPDFSPQQTYLNPAGKDAWGVGARAGWAANEGARGRRVKVLDIEYGWNIEHAEFGGRVGVVVYGDNDSEPANRDHGAAVLGIVAAPDDGKGVCGIAPDATLLVASPVASRRDGTWNIASVIQSAFDGDSIGAGDVILLEVEYDAQPIFGDAAFGIMVPVEASTPEQSAIRWATERGIYVVEAAANGDSLLDDPCFDGRFAPGPRDSGAIMVGAGMSSRIDTQMGGRPLMRQEFSNYGSRVDVQGWGDDVATVGGRSDPKMFDLTPDETDTDRCYTSKFNGTSSAAAMVAGIVACASGAATAAQQKLPTPRELRTLLVSTGCPPTTAGGIGPLPNLKALLDALLAASSKT